ncbi:MAG: HNH endonuclease [Dehalococcoidia bacterium]|nr:HNH endonuclease [Dehalococcoidia bacterium]
MPAQKKKVREGFIFCVIFVALFAFILAADWWETNQALGWTILGLVVALAIFALAMSSKLRRWLGKTAKSAAKTVVYGGVDYEGERKAVPKETRQDVYRIARHQCQNDRCAYSNVGLPIHHIDMDRNNNSLNNLIVLCPTCHDKAHGGKFSSAQLRNWVMRDRRMMKKAPK